jgi:hypothetical protein
VDRVGSTGFDDALANVLVPLRGSATAMLRGAVDVQTTNAVRAVLPSTSSAGAAGTMAVADSAAATAVPAGPIPVEVTTIVAEAGTCGSCGLLFSIEDVVGTTRPPIAHAACPSIGMPAPWTIGGSRPPRRSVSFET